MKAAFAALAVALATPAAAQDAAPAPAGRTITAQYSVNARGIDAGEFAWSATLTGDQYSAQATRRMTGLARALMGSNQDYSYAARGAVAGNGQVQPAAYRHTGGRRNRTVQTTFGGPDGATTTATPEMGMGNPPATAAQKRGAIDQVSMFLAFMLKPSNPCSQTVPVLLEGRSRFDFVMTPNGRQRVTVGAFTGEAERCRVQYRPISGFSDPQTPSELTFLFARIDGAYAPVQIEMPSDDAGVIRLDLRSFSAR